MVDSSKIYELRVAEVYHALETSANGLSESDVVARQELYGRNTLTEERKTPTWRKLVSHISHPMALLLWGAGVLAFVIGEIVVGLVIWILVLVNAGFSFWREYRAEQAMAALHKLLPTYVRLIRNGVEAMVPAEEVVPGDVMVLAEGDNIPADARVVEEYGLRINNATLTGEAVPARKSADASLRSGISEVERPNLVFAGTSVVSGTGKAVVYSTGMLTQFGRIAHLTQAVKEDPTPLQVEMSMLTRKLSLIALGIGAFVFVLGSFEVGLGTHEAFLLAMGILVAAIPEGLPATITLSLAIAGQRLAQRGVLVKKLSVVETLGTISTICTDKSGTLTQNQMTVREIWVSRKHLKVTGVGYEPKGSILLNPSGTLPEVDLRELLVGAALCNNSRLSPPTPERPQWSSLGDQTEAALKVVAIKGGVDDAQLSYSLPRIHELPFDARRKRMSTIHRVMGRDSIASQGTISGESRNPRLQAGGEIAYVKGAPREVLHLCTQILLDGEVCPLEDELRADILAANDDFARRALRVLAIARRELPPRSGGYMTDRVEQDLIFLGLMAMMDPPRPEVAQAIQVCKGAGIRIIMITGDYGLTAESLARRVGMLSTLNPVIITGAEIDELDDVQLKNLLGQEVIYARMAPEHKLRLVSALQANGEVVAVTGDGVNDAPALRKANVGFSMGIIGTDVAREAADIILTNDNFATIVDSIQEGRALYDNLRKFITYIFSSNVPEILPFIFTALLNTPLALTVSQILAIDLGTDMFPALALGMENPEPDVMQRPPRQRNQPLVDRSLTRRAFMWLGMIEAILCYTGLFLIYRLGGVEHAFSLPVFGGIDLSRLLSLFPEVSASQVSGLAFTMFLAGVVTAQIGNAFTCRTETQRGRRLGWLKNRYLVAGIAIEVGITLALIYIPPLAKAFDLQSLAPAFWLWLIPYGFILYGLDWIRKWIYRWNKNGKDVVASISHM